MSKRDYFLINKVEDFLAKISKKKNKKRENKQIYLI